MITALGQGGWWYCALALIAATSLDAQISPGALSTAHKGLAGQTQCVVCHALTTGVARFKCLNCHTEIRARIASGRGLHASQMKNAADQRECVGCHSEHNGERFVPIRWDVDLSEFNHGKTGYVLEGAHRGLDCRKCHTAAHVAPAARKEIKVKDLNRTYLGLSRECATCHGDVHRGQLPSDCLKCHEMSRWKPAPKFNHDQAKFVLTGSHQKVSCQKCHQRVADAKPYTKFAGLAYANCADCHQDPHRGSFTKPCTACHTDGGWKLAKGSVPFDHSSTRYSLAGKHAGAACEKCHVTADFKKPVAHARCADCHEKDGHGTQFTARSGGGECSACHVPEGWTPAKFDVVAHRGTAFPLEARHATVACSKCHEPKGIATAYRVSFAQCSDCHGDPHNRQFAATPSKGLCSDCHTVQGFTPSSFTLARHNQTRMPLTESHAAVPCVECHYEGADNRRKAGKFRFADLACSSCHSDPHKDQFRERMLAKGSDGRAAGCAACHTLSTWKDVSKFDHGSTSFALAGTHRDVGCQKCHPEADPGSGLKSASFRSAPNACAGCHEDTHAGQFAAGAQKADCARCHNQFLWKPASFSHDRQSDFALTGAHREANCRSCHRTEQIVNGRRTVKYKPTPRQCEGCHRQEAAG